MAMVMTMKLNPPGICDGEDKADTFVAAPTPILSLFPSLSQSLSPPSPSPAVTVDAPTPLLSLFPLTPAHLLSLFPCLSQSPSLSPYDSDNATLSQSPSPPRCGIKRNIGYIDDAVAAPEPKQAKKNEIEQYFTLGDEIGVGGFGSVRRCTSNTTGAEFACKTVPKWDENEVEDTRREIEIMQHLSSHPALVTLEATYEDSKSFHLIMEFCEGGNLYDQMLREGQKYSECRAASILKQLMLAIDYCHRMGVVHRDVKPENILLTSSGVMKLADFGIAARISNGQTLSRAVGTPAYAAPEVPQGNYTEKVDIWSAGVVLHALLVHSLPFNVYSMPKLVKAVEKANLDFNGAMWESISTPARDLIRRMLTRDVSKRATAEEVLRHPWVLFHTEQQTLESTSIK